MKSPHHQATSQYEKYHLFACLHFSVLFIISGVLIPASPVLGGRNTSMVQPDSAIVPAPAEILLGLSPTLEHQQNTSKTNYHQLKRALPTTIESFPDEVKFHAEAVVRRLEILQWYEIRKIVQFVKAALFSSMAEIKRFKKIVWCGHEGACEVE